MRSLLFKPELAELVHHGIKTETRRHSTELMLGVDAYVRESYRLEAEFNTKSPNDALATMEREGRRPVVAYEGSPSRPAGVVFGRLRPSIHLPAKLARTVVVVSHVVRWEPLHSIDDAGAYREGFKSREDFRDAWEHIHGRVSWRDNPLVAVIRFRRIRPTT